MTPKPTQHRFGRCSSRCGSDPIKLRDCAQNLAAMPQPNAQVLEVLLRQIANDREVNGVVSEALGVLSQADRCEPPRRCLSWHFPATLLERPLLLRSRTAFADPASSIRSVCCTLSVPQTGRQVLGADLNCSESRYWPTPLKCLQPEQDSNQRPRRSEQAA